MKITQWTIAAYDRKTEKFLGYRAGDRSFLKPFFLTRREAKAVAERENAISRSTFYVPSEI